MKMLTYNPTVLALQGGAGGADGATGTALAGCCFASTAVEGGAGAVGAGRGGAAGEGGAGTHSLAGDRTLPGENNTHSLHCRQDPAGPKQTPPAEVE